MPSGEEVSVGGAPAGQLLEVVDTTTSSGSMIFCVFGALAEFDCGLISERITAGLAEACAQDAPVCAPDVDRGAR